jgi:peptide/nickel transport system ATP-binding protein
LGFGRTKTLAVDHVDLDLYEGEVVSIVGESGSGKTTLAKMLLGLISFTEGEVYFQGKKRDISSQKKNRNTGRTSRPSSRIRSLPIISSPRSTACFWIVSACAGAAGCRKKKVELMTEACSFVNLKFEELTNKYPFELSGGQMQRLMIARIFLLKPKILLADEPTSMIDACSRATILDYLMQLRNETG